MKKSFKFYVLIWAILFAMFNLVVFLVRPVVPGFEVQYDVRFWIAWAFIVAAFIGNLICAYFAFIAENAKRLFYNLPLITISRAALVAMLIAGCALMLIPDCPEWIAAVACILILAFNMIAIVKAIWAAEAVESVDEKVKAQTSFIKNLTVDAENLVARAKSDAVRKECERVFDAVRYSDPMSNDALSVTEAKITKKIAELYSAAGADDVERAKEIADEIVALIANRNKTCQALK